MRFSYWMDPVPTADGHKARLYLASDYEEILCLLTEQGLRVTSKGVMMMIPGIQSCIQAEIEGSDVELRLRALGGQPRQQGTVHVVI